MTTPDGTDTPRTDAFFITTHAWDGPLMAWVGFAKQLERELAQTAKELAECKHPELGNVSGYVDHLEAQLAAATSRAERAEAALRVAYDGFDKISAALNAKAD